MFLLATFKLKGHYKFNKEGSKRNGKEEVFCYYFSLYQNVCYQQSLCYHTAMWGSIARHP